ncbi:MAG: ABC transporter substrate-binding protein [Xenococcaceae cyanobacterium]
MNWICDGVPKDSKQYPNCTGSHEPYENSGLYCIICGLPQEAMKPKPKTTVFSGSSGSKPQSLMSVMIAGVALLVVAGGGFGLYKVLHKDQPSNENLVSEGSTYSQMISQGERLLLNPSLQKRTGATAFKQRKWDEAITQYQQAADLDPNDPEGKIYHNNAKARKTGNPLTIAVVVPIDLSSDSAKEILRGVASYQEEFNQSLPPSERLLEVVIVNDSRLRIASYVAQDIINSSNVLGVLGYGIDQGSQEALKKYDSAGLAALSPLTTSVEFSGGKSILKTITLYEKKNELLGNYLQAVSKTLTEYASKKHSPPSAVIFYNSDSLYSEQLKEELVNALPKVKGRRVKEIDITASSFNAASEIASAKGKGANTAFLALSKNKVRQAVTIAKANANSGVPLILMGGDELYNPKILKEGGDEIKGIVLAVPWSFKPGDPFAKDAAKSWQGRVSWRTATAYDATKALADAISQNPSRSDVSQLLNQGIPLTGNTTNFNIFNEVPLVQAVRGKSGPKESGYQFDAIE